MHIYNFTIVKRTLNVYLALKNKSQQKAIMCDVLSFKKRAAEDKTLSKSIFEIFCFGCNVSLAGP